jgi:hypothetical protein
MDKKGEKRVIYILVCCLFISILLISFASAGWADWVKKTITGKATTTSVEMNVTVGVPAIIYVWNYSAAVTPSNAPAITSIHLNFTVYIPSGYIYLNTSLAKINITKTNEAIRQNTTCMQTANWSTNYANFSCNVTLYWWDLNGTWTIGASITDNSSNLATNYTQVQRIGVSQAFVGAPGNITWSAIASGARNQTPTNDPFRLNNTGNAPSDIQINATNLRGETDAMLGLWANNFTVSGLTGGTPPAECNSTLMSSGLLTTLTTANLTRGNYTINDGSTGAENLYLCLRIAGAELTTQAYSTRNESYWTVKIV